MHDDVPQLRATADVDYFLANVGTLPALEEAAVHDVMLKAYRWQYLTCSPGRRPAFLMVPAPLFVAQAISSLYMTKAST